MGVYRRTDLSRNIYECDEDEGCSYSNTVDCLFLIYLFPPSCKLMFLLPMGGINSRCFFSRRMAIWLFVAEVIIIASHS